ncbi:MAG: hypothetical protein LN568_05470 [Rickettsia endosymbiont of Pseudomimeciton antennatum]|nr:hypothetical protein [Rickettsia endosymbiont of Pseudomimeciton antennatum]
MKNWNVKQGVSVLGVDELREHANTPQVFAGANSSKQKSIMLIRLVILHFIHRSYPYNIKTNFYNFLNRFC